MLKVGSRILFMLLGILCTVLGIVGVWVPGMPTTVFILIALWAFSRSSQRLHQWLVKLPVLKQAIYEAERFQREGTVDRRVKVISQGCSWVSFVAVALLSRNVITSLIVLALAISCSAFMWWVPTAHSATIDK